MRHGCAGGQWSTAAAGALPAASLFRTNSKGLPRGRIDEFGILQLPKKVAECADGVVRDRPVHRWARGARARRPCAASITPSASSTPAEGLRGAYLPALQHPAWPLDAGVRRNRQVRTSMRTLREGTREVAQRAQRHARVLLRGHR
jgi:hypothetical protein